MSNRKGNNRIIEKGWIIIYIIKVENLNETLKTIENEKGWTVCK